MGEKKWWLSAVGVLMVALMWFAGCEKLKSPAPSISKDVVATVNNHVITDTELEARISRMPAYYQQVLKDRKNDIVNDMVLEYLLYDEAKKRGFQKDKEVRDLLEETEKRILVSKLLKEEIDSNITVSDKDVEDYYNANKDQYVFPERWRASHILVKTEQEAKAALSDLSKGKSFEELAKEKSQDTTAQRGGDIGYFTKGQLTPEFEAAAVKLEVGQVSGIVKTDFGYHIIKLTDHKPAQPQELKEAAPRIMGELKGHKQKGAFDTLIANLKKKASIKINEDMLVSPPQPDANTEPGPGANE